MQTRDAIALSALFFVGCASAPPRAPTEVAAAAREAAQLSASGALRALLVPDAADTAVREALSAASGAPAELSREARWTRRDREPMVVRDGRIQVGALGLERATTPIDAALLLGRALRDGDPTLLLSLLPAAERRHWAADSLAEEVLRGDAAAAWRALGDALAAGRDLDVRPLGPARAEIAAGGRTVVLTREADGWKVLDIDPEPLYTAPP